MVAVTMGLMMAPAAYHRQAERDRISRRFVDMSSRMLSLAMLPHLPSGSANYVRISFSCAGRKAQRVPRIPAEEVEFVVNLARKPYPMKVDDEKRLV